MDRTLFAKPTSHDMFVFGMERLLNGGIYSAAYPLHDVSFYFNYNISLQDKVPIDSVVASIYN